LNAHCERWIKSVKTEALSKMILFGEASLRHMLANYVEYHHSKRNHQGKGNLILFNSNAEPYAVETAVRQQLQTLV
jgi:hypothetical protein